MQRAILKNISFCDYFTNEEPEKFVMGITVCYQDTVTRIQTETNIDVVISTAITAPFVGPQLRDAIIAGKPEGFSLGAGDIIMFSFSKGNAL